VLYHSLEGANKEEMMKLPVYFWKKNDLSSRWHSLTVSISLGRLPAAVEDHEDMKTI
jgi:hypothetical protein